MKNTPVKANINEQKGKFKFMKKLQIGSLAIALIILLASCQSASNPTQILSNEETRKEIMDSIANDSEMMSEMMTAMMNSESGKTMMMGNGKMHMMMMENRGTMMRMMKDNPNMMEGMMGDMLEACKNDTSMMSSMCKTIMKDPKMMDMMDKMKGAKMNMNRMDGMNQQ